MTGAFLAAVGSAVLPIWGVMGLVGGGKWRGSGQKLSKEGRIGRGEVPSWKCPSQVSVRAS